MWLEYQVTRGACITLQAAVRGHLVRREIRRTHRAATTIQSTYRCWRQQQKYQSTRNHIIQLQIRIRAYLEGRRVQKEYIAMKAAAVTIQSAFRGLIARQLATQHRAARQDPVCVSYACQAARVPEAAIFCNQDPSGLQDVHNREVVQEDKVSSLYSSRGMPRVTSSCRRLGVTTC